jgi:hypothetical protein|tara:strand:- start:25 stop:243 length:219 start_codon:yes stop_codon:yes gene_type:complete
MQVAVVVTDIILQVQAYLFLKVDVVELAVEEMVDHKVHHLLFTLLLQLVLLILAVEVVEVNVIQVVKQVVQE